MDRQDRPAVAEGPPERVPVVVVEARVPQGGGILGEGERVAALFGDPPDFGGQLGVPDGRHRHGDEAARVGPAPFVDVPVVVRPDEGQREIDVVGGKDGP